MQTKTTTATTKSRNGDSAMKDIIGYGSYGQICGWGALYTSLPAAARDLRAHARGCRQQGGYSDRRLVAVDEDGYCYSIDEESGEIGRWVRGPGGCAARYTSDEIAEITAR